MKILIEITPKRIADLMVTAIEGNHMTRAWCAGMRLSGSMKGQEDTFAEQPWYSDPALYTGKFTLEIYEIEDESLAADIDTKQNVKAHKCSQIQFANGFQIMAQQYGRHFGAFQGENEDGETADVFLQCVALGEVVYG